MGKEYVPREEVIKILEKYDLSDGSTLGYHSGAIECAISEIEMLPAADVVEVVRCKDCIRRGTEGCAMYWDTEDCAIRYGCEYGEQHTWETDNDFCSWGERRDNA